MIRQARNEGELMQRQLIVLLALLLGACASTGPDPATSNATPPAEVAAVESTPASAPSSTATAESEDRVIEALPAESAQPAEEGSYPVAAAPPPNPVVCQMERRTGSNRKVKVCRRAPSALDEADTQQTFDSLRRSQMGEHR